LEHKVNPVSTLSLLLKSLDGETILRYIRSAGSGKTYALVKEYLKIILVAKKMMRIAIFLAITFTNKAVHEMKSRIVGSLSEFAKDDPAQKRRLMQI
jgi:superfamily I DNA/RNA helicase